MTFSVFPSPAVEEIPENQTRDSVFSNGCYTPYYGIGNAKLGSYIQHCAHAIQWEKGDRFVPSLTNVNYEDDRHEKEAWQEAARAFKEKYPGASGIIETGKITIDLSKT